MATILYSLRKTPVRISKILLISLIPVFYGAAIEIMQGALTSYRSNDVMDFAANVVGVYVAVGGYYLVKITKLFEHK